MNQTTKQQGVFEKTGECLYRYSTSGAYYAVIRHQGKLIRRSLKTDDRPLAKRRLGELRQKLNRIDFKAGRVTVAELADRYLATVQHLAPSTLCIKRIITARVKADWPGGAQQDVRDVRESHLKGWLGIQAQRMGKSGFNAYVQHIRTMFRLAVADRLIVDSPAADVKQVKRDKPIRQTPTLQEFQSILDDIRQQKFNRHAEDTADFVEFLGLAGVGNGEAASLKWSDVDFDAGRIRLYRHKTDTGFVIPVFPQLRPLLARLHGGQGHAPDEPVFKIANAKKALAASCKRLGLPNFSHRSFRRMFIVRAIERGIDVKVISQWQGHRDGGTLILQTYSHVRQPHADAMARLLTPERGTGGLDDAMQTGSKDGQGAVEPAQAGVSAPSLS